MLICLLLFALLHLAGFYGLSAGWDGGSVTEMWNWVGRDFKHHPAPALCRRQGHIPPDHVFPNPIHPCLHPAREKCSLLFELSSKLLFCSPWLFWVGLGAPCTRLCPGMGFAIILGALCQEAALKGTQGICANPPGSLQAALGSGLKDWEGNLWSGSLEPA